MKFVVHKRTKAELELVGSVALVGNSDGLLDKGYGSEIDSYDHVFRFNLADTSERYQKDCGKKMDYCFFSLNISTHQQPLPTEKQQLFRNICRKAKVICYPNHDKYILPLNKRPLYMMASVDDVNFVFHTLLGHKKWSFSKKNQPRNGVKLLACLLQGKVKPVLYGFDVVDRGDNQHYFDNEVQVECEGVGHRPSVEYGLIQELHEKGLLELKP